MLEQMHGHQREGLRRLGFRSHLSQKIGDRQRIEQKRLPDLKVVSEPPSDPTRVFFGAWVTLEDENAEETVYRIVGADEFDPASGWISTSSPMAIALLKKTLDDEVQVETPAGKREYVITAVSYTAP